ncbi:hypothetical protein BRADI_3g08721v3, partial [Brachypodium distachyon]
MKRMRLDSNGDKEEIPAESSSRKLCDDLLEEIFSRLPARSAALCAALSKRWRDIAYVHEYAAERDGGHKSLQHALHHVDGPCSSSSSSSSSALAQGFLSSARHGLQQRYVGTCNGLVALEVQGLYNPRFFTCAVLNPATAEEASLVYLGLAAEQRYQYWLRGFGYGPASRTYKLLVVRRACPFSGGPLQVVSLQQAARGEEARTVFPELDGGDHAFSLCIGGQVCLLDGRKRRVLIFDVDSETVRPVRLPAAAAGAGTVLCSELMEVSGNLCVAVQDEQSPHEVTLWLLTPSLDWQKRCVMGQVAPRNNVSHCWLVGAWDCGGNRLLV